MPIPDRIAIDGPAASGKSTIGERLAQALGYLYFDTGLMYRAVTLAALQELSGVVDEEAVTRLAERISIDVRPPSIADGRSADVLLEGRDITWEVRQPEVDAHVSQVSAYPGVRQAMTIKQRLIGRRGKVVMVGRDIGTVVLPDAELKIYLDASVEERARRRYSEQVERGVGTPADQVLESMRRRDKIDSTRTIAPLRPADDAVCIKTDGVSADEVFDLVMRYIQPSDQE